MPHNFYASIYKAFIYLLFHYIVVNVLFPVQVLVVHLLTRPVLSYFPSSTKKDWHHSRARWKIRHTQFIGTEVMVQHLVEDFQSTSAIMPTVTLVHTHAFMVCTTHCQVEYRTSKHSLLGLTTSHPMRWKYFISPESHYWETTQWVTGWNETARSYTRS